MNESNCIMCDASFNAGNISYCPSCAGAVCDECSQMNEGYCENCYDKLPK